MNKTISIKIAGSFFHIDEDAYARLKSYLEKVRYHLKDTKGKEDIMYDVEARIAELLAEQIHSQHQVISIIDIDKIIKIIGRPEEYDIDKGQDTESYDFARKKKFYRDVDDKYIGGVCSGLGHYLGVNALVIRLILTILTLFTWGGFTLIYVLIWILVPAAVTTSQKLDMKGEPVNLDNIERKIREEFDDISAKVKNKDYGKVKKKARNVIQLFFETIGRVIKFIFNALTKFFGAILFVVSGILIIFLFVLLIKGSIFEISIYDNYDHWWWLSNIRDFSSILSSVTLFLIFILFAVPLIFVLLLASYFIVGSLSFISRFPSLLLLMIWLFAILGIAGVLATVL